MIIYLVKLIYNFSIYKKNENLVTSNLFFKFINASLFFSLLINRSFLFENKNINYV